MRPTALAICMSVFTAIAPAGSFAQGPVSVEKWSTVYDAGLAANQTHNYEESLRLFQQSWETARTPGERGVSAIGLGQTYRRLDRLKDAKEWLERARQALSGDPRLSSRLAVTTADLADLYRTSGDYPDAERLLREMLLSPSCDAESKALLRNSLADLLREEGRSTEAQPLFAESAGLAAVSWKQRLSALVGLADIDGQNGDWEASVNRWNEALEMCRREHDAGAEAVVLRGLGTTWLKAGDRARAELLLRRSLWIMENNSDIPQEQVAGAHSGLAELYRSENKLALAEDELSRALRIDHTVLGDAHPQVAILLEMLSDVYSARGEFGLAREYATQASETMSSSFGENSMAVAAALTNRAAVEEWASDLGAAAKDYERAIDIARAHPEHRSLESVMIRRYAGLLKVMHRPREAKVLDAEAHSYRAK